jgi:hypothetical protein
LKKAIVEFQAFAGLNITGNHCSVLSIMQELKYQPFKAYWLRDAPTV